MRYFLFLVLIAFSGCQWTGASDFDKKVVCRDQVNQFKNNSDGSMNVLGSGYSSKADTCVVFLAASEFDGSGFYSVHDILQEKNFYFFEYTESRAGKAYNEASGKFSELIEGET